MSSTTAAATTPHHATHTRIEHGVPVNPSQIEAVDAAATTTTTRSITQAELVSESFLPADSRRRQDGSDADTRTTIVTATTVPSSKQQISGGGAGGGGGRNDGKAAVDASLGASRLPQSGLRFCGYKWLLGAEDMLIPAACSIPSDLFVFVLSLVCIGLLPRHYDDMPDTCSHKDWLKLQGTIITLIVVFFLLVAIDIGTMLSAWYSDMFKRNRLVPLFMYIRMFLGALIAATALVGCIFYFTTTRDACTRPYSHALDISTFMLYVCSMVITAFVGFYFLFSYGMGQCCAPRAADGWQMSISKWFRGKNQQRTAGSSGEADHDVFSSVATIFSEFFSSTLPSSQIHVVPSDIAVALCLVQAEQKKRRRDGEKFYVAAGKRRWDTKYIEKYYDQSVARAEAEEKKKQHAGQGTPKQRHNNIQQTLQDKQQHVDGAPLPIKSTNTPNNRYTKQTKEVHEEKQPHTADSTVLDGGGTVPAPPPSYAVEEEGKDGGGGGDSGGRRGSVSVTMEKTQQEMQEHEQHLEEGPGFADRSEAEQRMQRRALTPNGNAAALTPQMARQRDGTQHVAELTEIVTDQPLSTPQRSPHPSTIQPPTSNYNNNNHLSPLPNNTLHPTTSNTPTSSSNTTTPQLPPPSPAAGDEPNPFESDESIIGESEEDMAEVALSGRQPRLLPVDWEKISEGKHYYDFACGSYGWMLYTWNHLSCLATCRLCRRHTPLAVDEMEGSGCSPIPCLPHYKTCLLSVRAFEVQSKIASREILYCHLSRAPVYYVVIDRPKKALVVSVRGTLSIADALIDLDAQLASLAPFGYPHGYTHQGILQNALHLRDHMDKKGVVAAFFRLNPDYKMVITGHSLGAGTAAALTFVLRHRFATTEGVPPSSAIRDVLVGANKPSAPSPLRPAPHEQLPTYNEHNGAYLPASLHTYIYGSPLLVDPMTAQSPFAMSCITTFIYHDDMIARMSLASLFALKQQMVECYEKSESRKWKIMRQAWKHQWDQMDKYDEQHAPRHHFLNHKHLPSLQSSTPNYQPTTGAAAKNAVAQPAVNQQQRTGAASPANKVELQSIHIDVDAANPTQATSSSSLAPLPAATSTTSGIPPATATQPVQVTTTAIEETTFVNERGERRTEVTEKKSTFSIQLRKMYLPGRIYLLLPVDKDKTKRKEAGQLTADEQAEDGEDMDEGGMCVGSKSRWVVFPAAHESFGEVIVNSHMFNDHIPVLSAWKGLNVPERYSVRDGGKEVG